MSKKVFGYKTTNDDSLFPRYKVRGFVVETDLSGALSFFGLKRSNGYDLVAALTRKQVIEEQRKATQRVKNAKKAVGKAKNELTLAKQVLREINEAKEQVYPK
jgi:uncharacterized membrane protein